MTMMMKTIVKKKLTKINKIHLKHNVIECSVVNGLRQPIHFSFILDKPGC